MRTFAILCGLILSSSAIAADYKPYQPGAAFDWNGAYAGIFAGTASSKGTAVLESFAGPLMTNWDVPQGLVPRSIGNSKTGVSGGLAVGYNVQAGSFVGGVEADVSFAKLDVINSFSRFDNAPGSPIPGVHTNTSYETRFGPIMTARLRAGFAFDRTMVYGTAGLATGKITNRTTLAIPELAYRSPDWSTAGYRAGIAYGVGVEHRITDRIGIKLEALALNFKDTSVRAVDTATFPGESFTYKFKNEALLGRVGLYVAF